MTSKDQHPEDLGEFLVETKLQRSNKIKDSMKDGVDYGKLPNIKSDFLWVGGAAKLADEFGYTACLRDNGLNESSFDGLISVSVTLDILDADHNIVGSGIGTWDNQENLGNMKGARARGYAMAWKRAFVLGIRYACNSFGIFSQDEDIVKMNQEEQVNNQQVNNQPIAMSQQGPSYDSNKPFSPAEINEVGVWVVSVGKHAGKELEDVVKKEAGWTNWVLSNENLVPEIKLAIESFI